ncbi:MAG: hypothetical protein ABJO67_13800 [Pseudoruegeria sp.]
MIRSVAFIGTSHSAIAGTCLEIINNMIEKDQLYADLLAAPTEMAGIGFNNELWEMWITGPMRRHKT